MFQLLSRIMSANNNTKLRIRRLQDKCANYYNSLCKYRECVTNALNQLEHRDEEGIFAAKNSLRSALDYEHRKRM